MTKIAGTVRCKRCYKTFDWYAFVPAHVPGAQEDISEEGKAAATIIKSGENGEPQMLQTRCRHCSEVNKFSPDKK